MWLWLGIIIHLVLVVWLSGRVLLQRKPPIIQLGWILALAGVPVFGVCVYAMFGTDRLRQRRLRRQRGYEGVGDPAFQAPDLDRARPEGELAELLGAFARMRQPPATAGNDIDLLACPEDFYRELERAIGTSTRSLWLTFYVWRPDEVGTRFRDLLIAAAERGVEVRMIIDEVGSGATLNSFFEPLVEAGGHMTWANTIAPRRSRWNLSLRNHRKLVICDGRRAFFGGVNIGEDHVVETPGYCWRDMHFSLRGPAIRQLAGMFADDWHFACDERLDPPAFDCERVSGGAVCQLVAGAPDGKRASMGLSVRYLVASARERLVLSTPYFAPDEAFLCELELAVHRGVRVQLLVSRRTDMGAAPTVGRSFYRRLLQAGVAISEYPEDIHHTKLVMVDGSHALIGSVNLDVRSFDLNFELGVVVHHPPLIAELEAELAARDTTSALILADVEHQPFAQRLKQRAFRLVAQLL